MEDDAVPDAEAAAAGVRKRKWAGVEGDGDGFGCAYDEDPLLGDTTDGVADEGAVAEVMRWLEAEISPAAPEQELGFVTINGNEESCGPSFSAAASSVMASVDTRAGAPPPPPVPWPWPEPEPEPEPQRVPDAGEGGEEEEEEWLARLLTCGPDAALEAEAEAEPAEGNGALLA
ncbi:hypothetical protein BS78_03G030200 [Paspalum vaginatum]|nr:hypothetical protein BS78_03G030200 [Paspalum vaginatum]